MEDISKLDQNRIFKTKDNQYYLDDEYVAKDFPIGACNFCALSDLCDQLSDELNNIEYCICLGEDRFKKIKLLNPKACFRIIL